MFNPMGMIQALGGMANFRNQINQFQQNQGLVGRDPEALKSMALQRAQQMLNSGQMTQEQYNWVMQFAGAMTGQNTQGNQSG
jgi:hypothetical protein